MITKGQFVSLAEAYIKQSDYETEVEKSIFTIARKYGQYTDFLGFTVGNEAIKDAVLKILGEDFDYFYYECQANFRSFNERVELADGKKPNIHSLEDLYDFAVSEGSIR